MVSHTPSYTGRMGEMEENYSRKQLIQEKEKTESSFSERNTLENQLKQKPVFLCFWDGSLDFLASYLSLPATFKYHLEVKCSRIHS